MPYINLPSGQMTDLKRKSDQTVVKGVTGYDPDQYDLFGSYYAYGGAGGGATGGGEDSFVSRSAYESEAERKIRESMEGLDREGPTPEDEKGIQERYHQLAQTQIDAINKVYAGLISQEKQAGVERLGATRSMGARAGLLGSPMGSAQMEKTKELTTANISAVQAEQNYKIQTLLGKADERAEAEIRRQKDESAANTEKYMKYLKDNLTEHKEFWGGVAESGQVTLGRMKANKDFYEQALEETGMSEMEFDFFFDSKMPKAQRLDFTEYQYRGENGNAWIKKLAFDPETGKKTEYNYDIGLPYAVEEDIKTFDGVPYTAIKDANGKTIRYDRIPGVAGGGTPGEKKSQDWDQARTFINDNPKRSYDELFNGIVQYTTNLSDSDIKSLLKEKGINPIEEWAITKNWLKEEYDNKKLIQLAREKGYASFWGTQSEMNNYLNDLVKRINEQSGKGKTWNDIVREEGLM